MFTFDNVCFIMKFLHISGCTTLPISLNMITYRDWLDSMEKALVYTYKDIISVLQE
jgi:hypothetical protein